MSILHLDICQCHVWLKSLYTTDLLLDPMLCPTLLSYTSDVGCPFGYHCLSGLVQQVFTADLRLQRCQINGVPPFSGFTSSTLQNARVCWATGRLLSRGGWQDSIAAAST